MYFVFLPGGAELTQPAHVGVVVGADKQGVRGFFLQQAVFGINVASATSEGKGNTCKPGRITSYNVCYTKLLRHGSQQGQGKSCDGVYTAAFFIPIAAAKDRRKLKNIGKGHNG